MCILLLSSCSDSKQSKTMHLNIQKEKVTAFTLLPHTVPRQNGAKTTDKEILAEIVDRFNQIEYRYRVKEQEPMLGGVAYGFVITWDNGTQLEYHICNGDIQLPDGTWWEIISTDYPNDVYLADLLGIERSPRTARIWDPDKTPVKLEYRSFTEPAETGKTEDPEQIRDFLHYLHMSSYCESQGYQYEYDPPEGYFTITCDDGSALQYEISGHYIHCPDGIWLEQLSPCFRILPYLSQEIGLQDTE